VIVCYVHIRGRSSQGPPWAAIYVVPAEIEVR
jgi:hypothetical protein